MKLLVIIITYNAMKWAERCFSSLEESSVKNDVFVVDNGSTDGTQDYIKKSFPTVIFTQSETNLGFGRANNIGLQYALDHNYDYVYLLNQDAWVMPETFENLIKVQKNHPEYGILSPMQLQENRLYFDMKFRNILLYKVNNKSFLIDDFFSNNTKELYEVKFVMAAHWLISADCLKRVGGFSPTFPHYGEDNNFSQRTYYKGLKVGIIPKAIAIHDRNNQSKTKEKKMYQFYINILIKLSNPFLKSKVDFIYIIKDSLSKAIKFHSFKPFKYGYKVFCDYNQIIKNKNTSVKNNCAFLKTLSK